MIRLARLKDKKEVLKIYKDAQQFIKTYNSPQWQDGYPNKKSFLHDIKNKQIYVNEIDGLIVGVATILDYEPTYEVIDGAWLNNEPYKVIHRIATKIDCLGKGYAADFLDYIYKNLKCENIRIDTHKLNEPMIRFLEKNGFLYCGIIYLNQPHDKIRLAYQKVYKKGDEDENI